jgi:hypothetical protein
MISTLSTPWHPVPAAAEGVSKFCVGASHEAPYVLTDEGPQPGFWLGVAGQHELAAVGRWEMNVDHLDGSKFLGGTAGGQPRRQRGQTPLQSNIQEISQDEDMGLDRAFFL